jgi:hypothetical protein
MASLPNPFEDPSASDAAAGQAAACQPQPSHAAADHSDIGQIFVGARKLGPPEIWFENSAYPREDELLYEVLAAMVDPDAPCLREIPDAASFMIELGPVPLFLQMAS